MGTEARGVVIPERRDELKERSLRIRECGRGRDPHTRAAAGRVALEVRIVAVISDARREHRIGSGFADHDAIGDRVRARGNDGDRRVIGTIDRRGFRRELVQGDDVRGPDCRSFG